MKMAKKLFILGAVISLVGVMSLTAFAESKYNSPAEVVSGITGRELESIIEERKDFDKTYGKIALEANVLDEFKHEMLEMKKENLLKQVNDGKISQEDADEIIQNIENNQQTCDGTASGKAGSGMQARFGSNGKGQGHGHKNGHGRLRSAND